MTGLIIDGMAVRVSSPVLIGRSDELGRLRAALEVAQEGRSSAMLVAGEAGVGKTRLVSDFAALAGGEGTLVLSGGCHRPRRGGPAVCPRGRGASRARPAIRGGRAGRRPRSEPIRTGAPHADLGPVVDEARVRPQLRFRRRGGCSRLLLGVLQRLADEGAGPVRRRGPPLVRSLPRVRPARVPRAQPSRRPGDAPLHLPLGRTPPATSAAALPGRARTDRPCRAHRRSSAFDRVERREPAPGHRGTRPRRGISSIDPHAVGWQPVLRRGAAVAGGTTAAHASCRRPCATCLLAHVADLAEPTQPSSCVSPRLAGRRVDPALLAAAAATEESALYDALRECVGRMVLVPDPTARHRALRVPPRAAPGGRVRRPAARRANPPARGVRADPRGHDRGRRISGRGDRVSLVCRA